MVALAFVWWRTRARGRRCGLQCWPASRAACWPGLLRGECLPCCTIPGRPCPNCGWKRLMRVPSTWSSYRGRPVVLNLWATWCPPCRREMPAFEQAQAAFPNVAFVMVNQGQNAQQAQAFLERESSALTDVLLDPSSRTACRKWERAACPRPCSSTPRASLWPRMWVNSRSPA